MIPQKPALYPASLPEWGPYSKNYIGISHIPNPNSGQRFDLSIFPGVYRRKVMIPNVREDSGYTAWECAPDFSWFSHRHEIEDLQKVYADISFSESEGGRTLCVHMVNHSNVPQSLSLYFVASLHYPLLDRQTLQEAPHTRLRSLQPELPKNGKWVNAEAYTLIKPEETNKWRYLPYAGELYGCLRAHGLVGGRGIGNGIFEQGCKLRWNINSVPREKPLRIALRYKLPRSEGFLNLQISSTEKQSLYLKKDADFALAYSNPFILPSDHDGNIEIAGKEMKNLILDGFAIVEANQIEQIRFTPTNLDPTPEIIEFSEKKKTLILSYSEKDRCYGLAWNTNCDIRMRRFQCETLDHFLKETVNNNVLNQFGDSMHSCYDNLLVQPISMPPQSESKLHGFICCGDETSVRKKIEAFHHTEIQRIKDHESLRKNVVKISGNTDGSIYQHSQERMAANTLSNLVYPVSCRGKWITHFSPGRWWDTLYTWDSGFTALGLSTISPELSLHHIGTYLTGSDTPDQAAFVHYGSPVPTQIYAYKELWNQFPDPNQLKEYYPKFLHYYRFFSGKLAGTTTNEFKSNLIKTWDYFYNSGGWDDYPPQEYVHKKSLAHCTAPIINTAHTIRFSKILKGMAKILGENTSELDADIEKYSRAIQQAWDETSGYYGYLLHDKNGEVKGLLKHPDSDINYNMGMDGISPLMAGVGSDQQLTCLRDHLMSPTGLWTQFGLTTVSQSAPYYRRDGYWNGAVWMPHQWFFWKALLDIGDAANARKIAITALDTWANEVGISNRCYEHFIVENGRGAGWHHFSGLSTPVLVWYAAYFKPGTLTLGHDGTVLQRSYNANEKHFRAKLSFEPNPHSHRTIIITLPEGDYKVTLNGELVQPTVNTSGCLEITFGTQHTAFVELNVEKK